MYNDGGNVILAPVGICHVDQRVTDFLWTGLLTECLEQVLIAYHFPESIGAEQQRVSGAQHFVKDVDFDILMSCSKRTIDEIPLGMCIDLIRFNLFRLHEPGDQRMVSGDGRQRVLT